MENNQNKDESSTLSAGSTAPQPDSHNINNGHQDFENQPQMLQCQQQPAPQSDGQVNNSSSSRVLHHVRFVETNLN